LLHEANAILYICGACACWGYKFALALVEDDCLMWPHDKKLKDIMKRGNGLGFGNMV